MKEARSVVESNQQSKTDPSPFHKHRHDLQRKQSNV